MNKLMPKDLEQTRVLDYGYGIGYYSLLMAEREAIVVGIDRYVSDIVMLQTETDFPQI
jgi:2-polyprenyl-3-methyl-5-hydroxy-6-metoxy-1,4-benzoquinol methylase